MAFEEKMIKRRADKAAGAGNETPMQLPAIPEEFKELARQLLAIGYTAGFNATDENCHADNISSQDISDDALEFAGTALNGDWAGDYINHKRMITIEFTL